MVVSLVLDLSEPAVGFDELIAALDDVSVAVLVLGLHVAGVVVVDGVRELVFRERLEADILINMTTPFMKTACFLRTKIVKFKYLCKLLYSGNM